jgi:hypothetical protein
MYLKDATSMTKLSGSDMSELMETTVPKLRLLRGGKGPPSDTGGPNWMAELAVGSVFSCRKKGQSEKFALMMLQILFRHARTIIVSDALNNNPNIPIDEIEFCKCHELVEVISQGDPNGHDLRTVRPPGVEDNVDAEGGQSRDD